MFAPCTQALEPDFQIPFDISLLVTELTERLLSRCQGVCLFARPMAIAVFLRGEGGREMGEVGSFKQSGWGEENLNYALLQDQTGGEGRLLAAG